MFAHFPCAWRDTRPATVDGRSGLTISGAAGDPTAASSAVTALAVADGVPPGAASTESIRHFDKRLCDAVTVFNERRRAGAGSAPRLEVAPGGAGKGASVTLTTGDSDNDFILLSLNPDGGVEPIPLGGGAIADRAGCTGSESKPNVPP